MNTGIAEHSKPTDRSIITSLRSCPSNKCDIILLSIMKCQKSKLHESKNISLTLPIYNNSHVIFVYTGSVKIQPSSEASVKENID